MLKIIKSTVILLILFYLPQNLYSQMPGWKFFKDYDGNTYYIDKNGKIRTSGKPEFKYKAVSVDGIDYYLNQGLELIKRHYVHEGIYLLKSILTIPRKNNRIYLAQAKASKKLNLLKKKYGDRYDRIEDQISILLYRDEKTVFVINENMFYSVKIPGSVTVLKSRVRKTDKYRYHGLLLGIRFKEQKVKKENFRKFDVLLAVDSEKFFYPFRDIRALQFNWSMNLGAEGLMKKVFFQGKDVIIYEFKNKQKPEYSGYEGIYLNHNYGYILRIVIPDKDFIKYKDVMKKVIIDFKNVRVKENL